MVKALHSNPNVYKDAKIFENGETLHREKLYNLKKQQNHAAKVPKTQSLHQICFQFPHPCPMGVPEKNWTKH